MIYKQTEHHSFPFRVKILFQRIKGVLLNKSFQGSSCMAIKRCFKSQNAWRME